MNALLSNLFQFFLANAPEVIGSLLIAILFPFVFRWIKANANKAQLGQMLIASDIIYPIVLRLVRITPGKIDDKIVEAFRVYREDLRLYLSKADEKKLTAILTAKHEEVKTAELKALAESAVVMASKR